MFFQPETPAAEKRAFIAHTLPMVAFLLLLSVSSGLKSLDGSFALAHAEFWIFPLQTVACAALLLYFRREYEFRGLRQPAFTLAVGLAIFLLWISPQVLFGLAPRLAGFNPDLLAGNRVAYGATVLLRFARLVVVVPLVEEIFWRGFLLRYLIHERFRAVAFGAFSWFSFAAVAVAFALAHSTADWPAALLTGAAYNAVAYRTKSLDSCVVAHAVTNLLLGLWIMRTGQWGFW